MQWVFIATLYDMECIKVRGLTFLTNKYNENSLHNNTMLFWYFELTDSRGYGSNHSGIEYYITNNLKDTNYIANE